MIGRGRIIADAPIQDIINGKRPGADAGPHRPAGRGSCRALAGDGVTRRGPANAELLEVTGARPAPIAAAALAQQVLVYELTPLQASWRRPTWT